MQMNRWLTSIEPEDEEVPHSPVRLRTSVWIDPLAQQNISASYIVKERRAMPNPQTPIPARASAPHAAHSVKVRPRYSRNSVQARDSDITQVPTLPQPTRPTMWQYESPDYEAESSLSSLSLAHPEASVECALDELDTLPPPQSREAKYIDEIDTLIPPKQHSPAAQKSPVVPEEKKDKGSLSPLPFAQPTRQQRHPKTVTLPAPHTLSEIATIPPGATTVVVPQTHIGNQKLDFLARVRPSSTIIKSSSSDLAEDAASWTAGQGKDSFMAKRIASRGQRKSTLSLNPLDRLRWWLLFPGRIEFLLWLSGTIVLVGVTCMLLFATLLSTGWSNAGVSRIDTSGSTFQTSGTTGSSTTGKASCTAANATSPQCHSTTVVSSTGLRLTLVGNALLFPGTPIYVHGQGFTVNNTVNFSYDTSLPCRPNTISSDTQGTFSLYLMLNGGAKAGTHKIVAFDVATKHAVAVTVTISPLPMSKTALPSPTQPGITPTVTSGAGGSAPPTPVSQTPVPITPTVDVTPTEVPTQQPTPTIGVTPSPTPGETPTVGITATAAPHASPTAGVQGTDGASIFKNALYEDNGHTSLSIWLWIAIVGYSLSMTLLGCAGLLYRRNRRISSR